MGRLPRVGESALVVGLQATVLVPLAVFRFVDGDEGVYAYASRLAINGRLPYRDFFYEQAPLLPYAYGPVEALSAGSWYALRGLSTACALAVGLLLYQQVVRTRGRPAALVGIVLYSASGLVVGYFVLVKTFALTALLLFAAFVLADRRRWVSAGILIGCAVEARLLLVAVVPVFVVAALRARRLTVFATAFVAALVPALILLAIAPRAFVFDNVRYHSIKSSSGLVGDLHEKAQTAATLLGLEPTDRALGVQFALLVLAAALALARSARRRQMSFPLAITVALAVVSFLPTPSYVQYFSLAVPFLILAALELQPRNSILALFCVAYLVPTIWAIQHFVSYDPVLRPRLASVRSVAATVDSATTPGEHVLSSWPGYLVGTHAWALDDYTNQFAPVAAARISAEDARSYHVATEHELEQRIAGRRIRLVVYRNWVTLPPFARWHAALQDGRYYSIATVATATIYTRR